MMQIGTASAKAPLVSTTRFVILNSLERIALQQSKRLQPLHDDLPLLDTGLDSLCIAILVAVLDDELGIDPFSSGDEVAFPVTVGDFIALYEHAGR